MTSRGSSGSPLTAPANAASSGTTTTGATNGSSTGLVGYDQPGPHRRGFKALALDFYDRYGMPLMLTETNMEGDDAPEWLAEVWNDTIDLKDQGLPVRGFCWYGFIDHVDWDTALTPIGARSTPADWSVSTASPMRSAVSIASWRRVALCVSWWDDQRHRTRPFQPVKPS